MADQTLSGIAQAFAQAIIPDSYWDKHPIARPADFEQVLRVDTLVNEGEGEISGIKVQIRLKDTTGVKPYLILDVEIDRLNGRISLMRRSDYPEDGATTSLKALTKGDRDSVFHRLLLEATVALLKQDGYMQESELLEEMLRRGDRVGLHAFHAKWRNWLLRRYLDAPSYEHSDLIHGNGMIPGRYYIVAEIPPAGFLNLTIVQFDRRSDWFKDVSREIHIHDRRPEGQMLNIILELTGTAHSIHRDRISTSAHTTQEYDGKVFEIDEQTVRELERYVSPDFDAAQQTEVNMPAWDKPLDTVELCLERIRSRCVRSGTVCACRAILGRSSR